MENTLNTALGVLFATFIGHTLSLLCLCEHLQAKRTSSFLPLLHASKSDHKNKINAAFLAVCSLSGIVLAFLKRNEALFEQEMS